MTTYHIRYISYPSCEYCRVAVQGISKDDALQRFWVGRKPFSIAIRGIFSY